MNEFTCGTLVGGGAPEFTLTCVDAIDLTPKSVRLADYSGRWLILIFYPRDFSFVCPTELTAFSARIADFHTRQCELLGISVDSIEMHQEWLTKSPRHGGLGPLQFPLASDPAGDAARRYGVWVPQREVASRGLFIVDPQGVLQYAVVHNLSVGRSAEEVLRVLDALRHGGLCPASWTAADGTIDPEQALRPDRVLGHYRIRRLLGRGAFGTVFSAWDLRLERMVALKVLKRNVFESRQALLSEARPAARLSHPNICTIYAVEEEEGLPVIVMEHLEGQPLSKLIAAGLPPDTAHRLAEEIAGGLAAAHKEGVVHGDLKPANIMVTEEGVPKILDFGLASSWRACGGAKTLASESGYQEANELTLLATTGASSEAMLSVIDDSTATVEFAASPSSANGSSQADLPAGLRGTPAYMSPEQAAGDSGCPVSDVFSFGLMLFEMLTGRPAIGDYSPLVFMYKLRTEDLADELAQQIPHPYRPLLASLLSRDPALRPRMQDVLGQLSAIHALNF